MLADLYWNEHAAGRHNGDISTSIDIEQHIFALHTEMIMCSIDGTEEIKVDGYAIHNLRYVDGYQDKYPRTITPRHMPPEYTTDDTISISESETKLQQLLDIVVGESEKKGLYLNSS